MAFKRDGDDVGLLNKLRQQRVDELFSYSIPEDEAFLMRNGRFACTVCYHRPVFDTVSMLAVHRGGKKHAVSVERKEREKEELAELYVKRQQEQFMRDGTLYNPQIKRPENTQKPLGYHPLLSSVPYNPRSKKNKQGHTDARKVRVNLSSKSATSDSGDVNISEKISDVKHVSLSNKDFMPQTISEYRTAQKCAAKREAFTATPYTRRNHTSHARSTGSVGMNGDQGSGSQDKNECSHTVMDRTVNIVTESSRKDESNKNGKHKDVYVHDKYHRRKRKCQPAIKESIISEKQAKAEKYLNLRGAGWKKDLSGNWVKDEDAEFDTDEEEPEMP